MHPPPRFLAWIQAMCSFLQRRLWEENKHQMHQIWCLPMLGERKKLLPKTPFINKDYKSFDLGINSYFVFWFFKCYVIYASSSIYVTIKSIGSLVPPKWPMISTKHVFKGTLMQIWKSPIYSNSYKNNTLKVSHS